VAPDRDLDLIVVGAGVAGATAARAVADAGLRVRVLEKSRGLGGRCATRRLDEGGRELRIDHGAQFFTVRDPAFQRQVDAWTRTDEVRVWTRGLPTWSPDVGVRPASATGHPRYVAPDGMSRLGRLLIGDVDVARRSRVARLAPEGDGWRLALEDDRVLRTRAVIVTAPAPQTLALLPEDGIDPDARAALATILYAASFAWMASLDGPAPAWPGLRIEGHPVLSWIASDGGKRRQASPFPVLVGHATPAFARARLEDPPEPVEEAMRLAVADVVGSDAPPRWSRLHRWRYALAETPAPDRFLRLAPGLIAAGDGFGAGRVEGAFLSGRAAAEAILADAG
jgi:predicted NAD/FAD-dependent oxidoreductase